MRLVVWSLTLVLLCLCATLVVAQSRQVPLPLPLSGEARPTQVPQFASPAGAQCDGSGTIYLRYALPVNGSSSLAIAKVHPDGETQTISLGSVPDSTGQGHAFIFVPAADGTLHEILRTQSSGARNGDNHIDYVRFDPDGSVRSTAEFSEEFIPSILVPLPNGNFFASGVTIQPSGQGVVENSLGGIFSADAQLVAPVRSANGKNAAKREVSDDAASLLRGSSARLGDDGNIYALLPGSPAEVAVIRQSGRIERVLHLEPPSDSASARDMWVSGGRLLVSYTGDSDDDSDSPVYVLYDASTGTTIRSYQPQFTGTLACFEDGQTLTVLVQASTGDLAIASAVLR